MLFLLNKESIKQSIIVSLIPILKQDPVLQVFLSWHSFASEIIFDQSKEKIC